MAEIIKEEGGKKGGKRRPKKHSTHIDMTPMVDLACLLLTFFMLTTAFSKPKVMEIVLPDKTPVDPINAPKVDEKKTINIILDANDKVYWYDGAAKKAPYPALNASNFSKDGIRKMLLNRNRDLFLKIEKYNKDVLAGKVVPPRDTIAKRILAIKRADKSGGLMVLIKAADKVKYGNIVDALDEIAICNIPRYAIVDLTTQEKAMLEIARQTK
jgi:biopolymer transport protein ExbD